MIPAVAHYTLHEWERRSIGDAPEAIPRNHAEVLVATDENFARQRNSANGKRPHSGDDDAEAPSSRRALIHWPRELQARERVGQIVAPGVSLEILPKIGGLKGDNEVRRRLVHMLGVTHEIDLLIGERAAHDRQNETLLDVLIRLFAQALLGQVRKGLPRTYISIEEDRAALRGKLNVNRQFSVLAASPQRLACGFDELSYNIPLNQIMATTVRMLRSLARTFETRRLLNELAFIYADISPLPISTLPWDRVQFDRSNTRWKDLFKLARLLVTRFWQNTGAGESQGTALLFDMNKLFESYVARRMASTMPAGMSLTTQGGLRHCLTNILDRDGLFRTELDILVRERGENRLVIDTKWKSLKPTHQDKKRGISQADIYQMMAYASLYGVDVLLLYPWHPECGGTAGSILTRYEINDGSGRRIQIACIDVSRDDAAAQAAALISEVFGHGCNANLFP